MGVSKDGIMGGCCLGWNSGCVQAKMKQWVGVH